MDQFHINTDLVITILTSFIRAEVQKVGFQRAVLGLSGGVDSSVVAYLAARALGPGNVLGVLMPYRTSSPQSVADAGEVVRRTGIRHRTVDISPQIDAYFAGEPDASNLRRGNKMARERMSVLYDLSMAEKALVLGTSNKTELLLGYGTQFGDLASALNPLGDLYKTQVWQLAKALGVPPQIIEKPPSADLWPDQSDEGELGFSYRDVDQVLFLLVDCRLTPEQVQEWGFAPEFIARVQHLVRISQYKRRLPLIAKISQRSVGHDFRYLRDWGA
ncbi:MAG: NAD+ synthase [Firmicutes bacterium]|nr:NAD+ synthase [Bacillota bacterium]